jgi:hypothetical protein
MPCVLASKNYQKPKAAKKALTRRLKTADTGCSAVHELQVVT